ncbi:MAG: hypothetical protein M1839_005201 [Geoglossum umbratile]|nr:MAG: hypothetical protein M1839_005201 [Geoglossum umbratile]
MPFSQNMHFPSGSSTHFLICRRKFNSGVWMTPRIELISIGVESGSLDAWQFVQDCFTTDLQYESPTPRNLSTRWPIPDKDYPDA